MLGACLMMLLWGVMGWWDVGHMLTSAIAEQRLKALDPYTYAHFRGINMAINNLCDNRSQTFVECACWADDLKGTQYAMKLWDSWHFQDSPYVQDGTIPTLNMTEAAVNSIAVVNNAIKVLKANMDQPTAERALFARYLVHIVGDIHQPLHSVALFNKTYPKGDSGGNLLKIKLLNGSLSNFHSFWDAGAFLIQNDSWVMVRPLNDQNLTLLNKVATTMIQDYGSSVQALGTILDPAVWALESYRFAQNTTYPRMAITQEAGEAYTQLAYETSKKRITLAGYRLANLAISIYNPSASISQEPVTQQTAIWNVLQKGIGKDYYIPVTSPSNGLIQSQDSIEQL